MYFWEMYEYYAYHRPGACPFDGQWSRWGPWSNCTATCGTGKRMRKRRCNNPAPINHGKKCSGPAVQREMCRTTCYKNFTAMANDDLLRLQALSTMHKVEKENVTIKHACFKDHCTFHQVHELIPDQDLADKYWLSMHCVERYVGCLVDGGWSDWDDWSNCTTPCGIGERFRIRRCNDPPPSNGGAACEGPLYEREDCLGIKCPNASSSASVWTDWSEWTKCSTTDCITYGTQFSKRTCIGVTMPATCDVGDGSRKSVLERRRPCVKDGCFRKTEFARVESKPHLDVPIRRQKHHPLHGKTKIKRLHPPVRKAVRRRRMQFQQHGRPNNET